jgi:hypothetical protein
VVVGAVPESATVAGGVTPTLAGWIERSAASDGGVTMPAAKVRARNGRTDDWSERRIAQH